MEIQICRDKHQRLYYNASLGVRKKSTIQRETKEKIVRESISVHDSVHNYVENISASADDLMGLTFSASAGQFTNLNKIKALGILSNGKQQL